MALTLTLREAATLAVDMTPLCPDKLAGLTLLEIAEVPLWLGKQQLPVGELFTVSGENCGQLIIQNSHSRLLNIGCAMVSGQIRVYGDAGLYTGRGMLGGEIQLSGNCGAYAGAEMQGGVLQIGRNAGDFVGAAAANGSNIGMRGGLILIKGNAGDRLGDRQRRGTILVQGNVGDYCASGMIAGTIAVLGSMGEGAGIDMRRGTLLTQQLPRLPATFNDNGEHELIFVKLLWDSFRDLDSEFASRTISTTVQRFVGDLACAGMGEVLLVELT